MSTQGYWLRVLGGQALRLAILALFLLTPRKLLGQVDEKRRAMKPDLVWLNLIPYFDYVWIPITLVKIRDSLRAEFAFRGGYANNADSAFKVGLASWVLYVATFALAWVAPLVPGLMVLFLLTTLAFLGTWIAYWAKCSSLSAMLASTPTHAVGTPLLEGAQAACLSCGAVYTPGDDFCRGCGSRTDAPAPSDAACPFCGAAYRQSAQFCSVCGRAAV
jgi:hypothetical protein